MKPNNIQNHKYLKLLINKKYRMTNYTSFQTYYTNKLDPKTECMISLSEVLEMYYEDYVNLSNLISHGHLKTVYFNRDLYIHKHNAEFLKNSYYITDPSFLNNALYKQFSNIKNFKKIVINHYKITRSFHLTLKNAMEYLNINEDDLDFLICNKSLRLILIRSCLALYTYEVEEVKDVLKNGDTNFYYSWHNNFNGYKFKKNV